MRLPLTEEEAAKIYPGFEYLIENTDHVPEAHEFVEDCLAQGIVEFPTSDAVWNAYEVYCFERGALSLPRGKFQQRFNKLAIRKRAKYVKDQIRPVSYKLKVPVALKRAA